MFLQMCRVVCFLFVSAALGGILTGFVYWGQWVYSCPTDVQVCSDENNDGGGLYYQCCEDIDRCQSCSYNGTQSRTLHYSNPPVYTNVVSKTSGKRLFFYTFVFFPGLFLFIAISTLYGCACGLYRREPDFVLPIITTTYGREINVNDV